ncbi:hypothetical protein TNCV_4135201 [Trichonephila clavipes]|nr:hypothetical protein TNCV_4135201 [Trichonephila clavipes]
MHLSQRSIHFLKTCKSPFCESFFKIASAAFTLQNVCLVIVSSVEETARNRMERDQDCTEGVVKSLRCSAVKHPLHNEQYMVRHCHGVIGSHFGAMAFPFSVLYHCLQNIRVARAVYGSTGFDSV